MRLSSLFVLIVLLPFRASSQNTISPGYIVRNGDTLRGDLKVDRQSNLMHQVSFQQDGKKDFSLFTPSDLSAFRYNDGALYRTISFVNTLSPNPVPETVFAHELVSGDYSLYGVYEDGFTYYIVKKDTATWFLYDDKILGNQVVHGNFRSLLLFFSAGCEGLDQSRASYSEKSLTDFIQRVDQCQAPGVASSNYYVKHHSEAHYFVYAGGLPAGTNNQVTLDAAVRFIDPRLDPKVSLNIALHYSNTGNISPQQVTFYQVGSSPYAGYVDVKASQQVFSVPVTLQYNILSGRIQPAAYVGFSAAYLSESPSGVGSGQRFGVAVIGGACIEAYITSRFFIKADWRYELLVQNPSIGVGFKF